MRFLIREKDGFLEAKLNGEKIESEPNSCKIDPSGLVHFGTDIVCKGDNFTNYVNSMEKSGVDYLFVSEKNIDGFFVVTAYLDSWRCVTKP